MHQPIPDAVVDAFVGLLAEKPYEAIGLAEVATRAGLTLGSLREAADGRFAILAAFLRRVDRAVLDDAEAVDPGDESGRDRLFDLMMRRLDQFAPHKAALRHLAASARRDPALALGLGHLATGSARYMLAASGIGTDGLLGLARIKGLVLVMGRLLPVWLEDQDPDQARTMASLDRALTRAEDWDRRAGSACKALCRIGRRFERRSARPARPPKPEHEAAA